METNFGSVEWAFARCGRCALHVVTFLPRIFSFWSKCDPEGHINSAFVVFLIDVSLVCVLEMSFEYIFSSQSHQERTIEPMQQSSMSQNERVEKEVKSGEFSYQTTPKSGVFWCFWALKSPKIRRFRGGVSIVKMTTISSTLMKYLRHNFIRCETLWDNQWVPALGVSARLLLLRTVCGPY